MNDLDLLLAVIYWIIGAIIGITVFILWIRFLINVPKELKSIAESMRSIDSKLRQ